MGKWPWQESTQDRLRRIIEIYRFALVEADPILASTVDEKMRDWGQGWICSDTIVDVNRLMSAEKIAQELGINPWNVHDWSRRHPDLIPRRKADGRTAYRLGDVLSYQAAKP